MNISPLKVITEATASVKPFTMHRINEFEGLRAILSWWVVWGHLLQYCGITINQLPFFLKWLRTPGDAVNVFIILSGFVIFFLLDNSKKNYQQFIGERFFRIYPLYITAFIAALLLMPLKVYAFQNGSWVDASYAHKVLIQATNSYDYLFGHVIAHVFLLHGALPNQLLPDSGLAFLAPAWSLSLEWQFYLIAPFLILCLRRSYIAFFLTLGAVFTIRQLVSGFSFSYGAFLPLKMEFFLIGIFSYYAYKSTQLNLKITQRIFPVLSIGLILGTLLLCFFPKSIAEMALPTEIWLIALCAAVAQSLQVKHSPFNVVARILNHPILQNLGKVSYSTYVTHILVFWVVMYVAMVISPEIDRRTMFFILSSIGIVGVVAFSFALYYGIEKPFIRLGKQVSKRSNSPNALS